MGTTRLTNFGRHSQSNVQHQTMCVMAVYYIISYDITDPESFSNYGPKVIPYLSKFGGEVLASDTDGITIEGDPKKMNAIIKFPSEDAALKCYNDAEYAPIKAIRIQSTTNNTIVLVKGFLK